MSTQHQTSVVRVRDASELAMAVDAARGGETILLADGDYGAITLSQRFDSELRIVAETQHGARFTGLDVVGGKNITLDGLFLDYDYTPGDKLAKNDFRIADSTGITLRNSLIEGDDRIAPGDPSDGFPTGRGLRLTSSDGIVIENNEIKTFWKGMNMSKSADVVIRGNEFHDIRSDGFNLVASESVRVENNHFHDFRTSLGTGDHPDMIQVWSTPGFIPRDLVFSGNYLDIGAGSATHGIFIEHNAMSRNAHGDDIAFADITITDNVVVGRHVHGITLGTTHGAVVANNTVLLPPDRPDSTAPRIKVDPNSTGVTLADNMAANFSHWETIPDTWTVSGNIAPQFDAAHLPHYVGDIFINALTDSTNAPENLQLVPGSAAALVGTGSSLLAYDPTPDTLTALARPETGAYRNEVVFDGRFSAGPDGPLDAAGATFHWDFGDGRTGSGPVVMHRYGEPGIYTAVLTVTLPDGTRDTTEILSRIDAPTILGFDSGQPGITVTTAAGSSVLPDIGPGDAGGLRFAQDTSIVMPRDLTALLENAQGLSFAARVTAEAPGTLIAAKYGFNVAVTPDGELQFYTPQETFVTSGADLMDGAGHDILVRFDGPGGIVRLSVDGMDLLEAPAPMATLPDAIDSVIKLGAARGDRGFAGTLDMVDLQVNPQFYDFAPAPTTPALAPAPDPLPDAPPPAAEPALSGQLEIGTLSVQQDGPDDWHSVTFGQRIADARVVMGPLSSEGSQAAFAQVRNVTEFGFEFQIDEWDHRDGSHVMETLSWIAASAGTHRLEGGQILTVGRTDVAVGASLTAHLDGFDAAPTVLTQVTGGAAQGAAIAQVDAVGAEGFDLVLRGQAQDQAPARSVDWMALEAADSFVFGDRLEAQVNHRWQDPGWPGQPDALLGAAQTETDPDPSVLRFGLRKDDTLKLMLQEDLPDDSGTWRAFEDVHVIAARTGVYDLFA